MTDTYAVKVADVQSASVTFQLATLIGDDSYASTRSFAIRLLFDAQRRGPDPRAATPLAARFGKTIGMESDADGPYDDAWFNAHARAFIVQCDLGDRRNMGVSGEEFDRRVAAAMDAVPGNPKSAEFAPQVVGALLDAVHSWSLTVRVPDAELISHLTTGQAFFTSAVDLVLDEDRPTFN